MSTSRETAETHHDEDHPEIVRTFGEARFYTDGDLLALAYSPDGVLCSIEEPGILRRWDATGTPIDRTFLSDLETLWAFSPGAKWVAAGCDELMIWDVATKKIIARLDQPSWITAIAFSSDHKHIATGHDDGIVRLWKVGEDEPIAELAEHDLPVSALAFDGDNQRLASAGEDRVIKVWNLDNHKLIRELQGHTDRIPGIAWHNDGKLLVSVGWDTTARVWNVDTGEPHILLNTHDNQVQLLAFSPDGKQLATADSASTVHLWGDLLNAQALHRLPGYAEEIRAIAFRPDGKRIAIGGTDHVIQVYDTDNGQLVSGGGLGVRRSVAMWNHSHRRLVLNAEEGLRVWDIETGNEQLSPLPPGRYLHVAASPDGRWLAAISSDTWIYVWDREGRKVHQLEGSRSPANFLTFSHDSKLLMAAVGNEGTVWLWDIERQTPALIVIEATVGCSVEQIALHPNGQWLLCGGVDFLSTSGTTGNTCVWDLPTKQRIHTLSDGATCLAFDHAGDRFAFATPDGTIKVIATESGETVLEIDAEDAEHLHALAFCPDTTWLIGAAHDSTLRVWDLDTGLLAASRQTDIPVHSFHMDQSGRLFAGCENATCCEIVPSKLFETA